MPYEPPIEDMIFLLEEAAGLNALAGSPGFEGFDADATRLILTEAGRLVRSAIAPPAADGDRIGARWSPEGVAAAPGFRAAYQAIVEGGWMGLAVPAKMGGQGQPRALSFALMDMMQSANSALALCPMLSYGAIEAVMAHGTPELRAVYLPKLASGEWTGAMNLTEPQAGTDVGALRTRAEPDGEGGYRITGQKIFITWGDHDVADNIVHLVLARLPDAPPGSRGVSLFLCPKFLPDADGRPGERNQVTCLSIESKIGIHGSPTCVMAFEGARGWLLGQPNRGLAAMFTMMNSARLHVGVQGVGLGEAAFQAALAHARERRQGRVEGEAGDAVILRHPDVARMLMLMQARTLAARAVCYSCAVALDLAEAAPSEGEREAAKARAGLLTPIAKAWSTDMAVEVTSLGVQVHGGMGYMNETEAARCFRDARIGPIYEGANGVQAADLLGRKLAGDGGAAMRALIAEMAGTGAAALRSNREDVRGVGVRVIAAAEALGEATARILDLHRSDRETALAASADYLALAGDAIGGMLLARAAIAAAQKPEAAGGERMLAAAEVFAEHILAGATRARGEKLFDAARATSRARTRLLGAS